jgi:hypothetical protein
MRALADVLNTSGTKQGVGPITTVTSVQYRRVLDGIGQATVTIPATDTRAVDLLAVRQRMTVRRPLSSGILTPMFTESIIVKMQPKDGPGGAEIVLNLVDKVSLLEDANTGVGLKLKGVTLDSAMTTLLALSSGFTHSFVDGGLSTLDVSMRFDGVPVLEAIKKVLAKHGLHWYAEGGTFYITSGGVLADGALYNMQNVPSSIAGTTQHATIQEIRREVDADGLVTKLVALGKGDGNNALTMRRSARVTPYTISSETVNSKTQYYISDSAAITAYGTITKIVKFDDITPLEATKAEKIAAANQLYDAAVEHLQRMKQPITRTSVTIRAPNTGYGTFGVPRPSEKRRVIYRGYTTQPDTGEIAYLSFDEELWVTGVSESLNLEGYSAAVELADYDVPPEPPGAKLVNSIKKLEAGKELPAVDPRSVEEVSTSNATVTTILSYLPSTGSITLLDGFVFAGKTDESAGLNASVRATIRRTSGGTTTVVGGGTVAVQEDSGSSPTVTMDVDGSNNARVRVTGVTAEDWDWKFVYTLTSLE